MLTVTHSSQLHHAVRSLKQLSSQEMTQLFKNSNWFEAWSLSPAEGQAVTKLFAKSSRSDSKASRSADLWG